MQAPWVTAGDHGILTNLGLDQTGGVVLLFKDITSPGSPGQVTVLGAHPDRPMSGRRIPRDVVCMQPSQSGACGCNRANQGLAVEQSTLPSQLGACGLCVRLVNMSQSGAHVCATKQQLCYLSGPSATPSGGGASQPCAPPAWASGARLTQAPWSAAGALRPTR